MIYTVRARIPKGAVCLPVGLDMWPMRADDPALEDDDALILAFEGLHPGDRCFILGQSVRRVHL